MRSLQGKQNVQAPTAAYPEGRIKDDDGTGTVGTPVNEDVYGDFHQFFSRLMVAAGLTPNELPENAYDGFQLLDALQGFNPAFTTNGINFSSSCSGSNGFGIRKLNGKIEMRGWVSKGAGFTNGQAIFTLPVGYRPSSIVVIPVGSNEFLSGPGWQILIDTSGVVSIFAFNWSSGNIVASIILSCSFAL